MAQRYGQTRHIKTVSKVKISKILAWCTAYHLRLYHPKCKVTLSMVPSIARSLQNLINDFYKVLEIVLKIYPFFCLNNLLNIHNYELLLSTNKPGLQCYV